MSTSLQFLETNKYLPDKNVMLKKSWKNVPLVGDNATCRSNELLNENFHTRHRIPPNKGAFLLTLDPKVTITIVLGWP